MPAISDVAALAPVPSRRLPEPPSTPTSEGVSVHRGESWLTVSAPWYSLSFPVDEAAANRSPYAVLVGADGHNWTDLNLLASVGRAGSPDETHGVGPVVVLDHSEREATLVLAADSTAWTRRETRVRCTEQTIEVTVVVEGDGDLDEVLLLGGQATLRSGAAGTFRSLIGFQSLFAPVPTEPVAFVRSSRSSAVLGVVGDADPGRLNGIFSPPPLVFGLGRSESGGAADTTGAGWLGLSVRAPVDELTFTTCRYEPLDAGFLLRLSYEGHTPVRGRWQSPTLVLRPESGALATIEGHRDDLIAAGFAPVDGARPTPWWLEPMFCGWGAQCARSAHSLHGDDPAESTDPESPSETEVVELLASQYARQDVYDEFLAVLTDAGVEPGTIVIDDRWQREYGSGAVDTEHWPDLRGWIADRHAEGRRVLLWWKAWDPTGLPVQECVTAPDGRAVAADPGSDEYLARVRGIVAHLLGPDGLDADGFKIDFTQRSPSGRTLRGTPGVWGIAALHRLLAAIHDAAKDVKGDALVVTHAVHPSFADVSDMVRLNDVLERDIAERLVPVADQLRVRHDIARAALPLHAIDTDQWPMPNRAEWLSYAAAQHRYGVPALYYAEAIDRSGERISRQDLEVVAQTWRDYRERVAGDPR